ncbi:MAG: hypothetical protein CSA64_01635 [Arachnia propionica]|nr:MAG: hypothetical protein CSA64_01635 [Arachnia propionica]
MNPDQQGMSNSVQLALLLPVAFFAFLATLQWAMVSWAEAIATAAAQEGARVAAVYQGSASAGQAAAEAALSQGAFVAVSVRVNRGSTQASCVVSGQAIAPLPGVATQINTEVSWPVEKLTG